MMPAGSTFEAFRLYLSKTLADVQNGAAGAFKGEFTTNSYVVTSQLDTDSTYYWRVDQRYKKAGATDPNTIIGGVVSFRDDQDPSGPDRIHDGLWTIGWIGNPEREYPDRLGCQELCLVQIC